MSQTLSGKTLLCGFLKKKSPKGITGLKAWQRRYFSVHDSVLIYAKSEAGDKTQGAVPISEIKAVTHVENKNQGCRFQIIITNRVFDLKAESFDEAKQWVSVIRNQIQERSEQSIPENANLAMTINASGKYWKKADDILLDLSSHNDSPTFGSSVYHSRAFTRIDAAAIESNKFGTLKNTNSNRSITRVNSSTWQGDMQSKPSLSDHESGIESNIDDKKIITDNMQTSLVNEDSNLVDVLTKPLSSWARLCAAESNINGRDMAYVDFHHGDLIEESTHGRLFEAIYTPTGVKYLMHVLMKSDDNFERGVLTIKRMCNLQHAFLIRRASSGHTPDRLWVVYEWPHTGALVHHLRDIRRLTEPIAQFIIAEVILAVEYLHQQQCFFRNLDPHHICLDALGHVILVDTSLHNCSDTAQTSYPSTLEYISPEATQAQQENSLSDLWRLGVLLYHMIVGFPPFRGNSLDDISSKIKKRKIRYPPFCSKHTEDLIEKLLCLNPNDRIGSSNMIELKQHEFFEGIDWCQLNARAIHAPEALIKSVKNMKFRQSENSSDVDDNSSDNKDTALPLAQSMVALGVAIKSTQLDLAVSDTELCSMTLFATISYSGKTERTMERQATLSPKWSDELMFDESEMSSAGLLVQIRQFNETDGHDDFVAGVLMSVSNRELRFEMTAPLHDKDGECRGSICVLTSPKSPATFRRMIRRTTSMASRSSSRSEATHSRRSTIVHMTDKIRGLVSKNKIRFQQDGFDLDLTYVTERLIAMGFPSSKLEGMYRNPVDEVQRFLKTYHEQAYRVYNLCSERTYEPEIFEGRCVRFPFDDHSCPQLKMMLDFCQDVDEFLHSDKSNVVIIHCLTGKGRTGLMIAAYMMFNKIKKSAQEALDHFAALRTADGHGVTLPSQVRYVQYFERLINEYLRVDNYFDWQGKPIKLVSVRFGPQPPFGTLTSCNPIIKISQDGKIIFDSQNMLSNIVLDDTSITVYVNYSFKRDMKISLYHKTTTGKKVMCGLHLHTSFINEMTMRFTRENLDEISKNPKKPDDDFTLELNFESFSSSDSSKDTDMTLLCSTQSEISENDEENISSKENSSQSGGMVVETPAPLAACEENDS